MSFIEVWRAVAWPWRIFFAGALIAIGVVVVRQGQTMGGCHTLFARLNETATDIARLDTIAPAERCSAYKRRAQIMTEIVASGCDDVSTSRPAGYGSLNGAAEARLYQRLADGCSP
jgi:hypothetical protein